MAGQVGARGLTEPVTWSSFPESQHAARRRCRVASVLGDLAGLLHHCRLIFVCLGAHRPWLRFERVAQRDTPGIRRRVVEAGVQLMS